MLQLRHGVSNQIRCSNSEVPQSVILSDSCNHVAGIELDESSSRELVWLLDHFVWLDHWKILEVEREIAISVRDKLERNEALTHRDAKSAYGIVNKIFEISSEIPRAQFRWKEDDFLELSGVLEEIATFVA